MEDRAISASYNRSRIAAATVPLLGVLGLAASGCGGANAPKATAATLHPEATPTKAALPVAPLTGLPVSDPATTGRPALSVKIDNAPGSFPQSGLDRADIVTEALVEGGLTRIFATFQSQDTSLVGPIRSARPVDAALLKELGCGIFVYSGAAKGEIAPAKAACPAQSLVSPEKDSPGFQLVHWRSAPHNTYSSTGTLYNDGRQAGVTWAPPPQLFAYSPAPQGGTAGPLSSAYMDMSPISSAQWTWDAPSRRWQRSQDGAPDMNADGSRISTDNVVILSTAIAPTGIFDAAGNQDPLVELIGSGTAWVLRDGQELQGTWSRPGIDSPMTITGTSGVLTLHPGTTWLELLPRPHLPRLTP